MNARSEGDEAPLWVDAHACQRHEVEEPEGMAAHHVEGAGASTHSHSEWIVGRK